MRQKTYLVEFIGGAESEMIIVRDPRNGQVLKVASNFNELADFLREDVDKK